MCQTDTGLSVSVEPYQTLSCDVTDVELGRAIASALEKSNKVIRHPTDWKTWALPRYAAAGVKTERSFQRRAKLVTVEVIAGDICLVPYYNGGGKGEGKGFAPLDKTLHLIVAKVDSSKLGKAVRDAFLLCTGET
jgi:hypothetical protein